MPDGYHPPMPRRNPEDIDLGASKADLEFFIERRSGSAKSLETLYVVVGSAAIVIAWIKFFRRVCHRVNAHHAVSLLLAERNASAVAATVPASAPV
jgi:hypothetical protein